MSKSETTDRPDLTGSALKSVLWDTLLDLREARIEPHIADSVAVQAREIVRVVRAQVSILNHAKQGMSNDLVQFATGTDVPRERGL